MGLGIFLKLVAVFSPKWSVPWCSHCLEVLLSPVDLTSCCRDPSTVSVGFSYSRGKRRKHICVFAHPGEEEAGLGKKQEPPGPGCACSLPSPAVGALPAWPSCLLPPTIWKHSTVFFEANAKHFTPGNQWWQVGKSSPFAVERDY